jgi:hypothetical protein
MTERVLDHAPSGGHQRQPSVSEVFFSLVRLPSRPLYPAATAEPATKPSLCWIWTAIGVLEAHAKAVSGLVFNSLAQAHPRRPQRRIAAQPNPLHPMNLPCGTRAEKSH